MVVVNFSTENLKPPIGAMYLESWPVIGSGCLICKMLTRGSDVVSENPFLGEMLGLKCELYSGT